MFLEEHLCYSERPWYIGLNILQRLPLTRVLDCEGFFLAVETWVSWTSINCFHGSPHRRMYEGRRVTRIISNDDGVFNYFIKEKDYIVETTI